MEVKHISGLIFDETEYAGNFGNIHKIIELINFFKSNLELEKITIFVVSGDAESEHLKTIKAAFGQKFTTIRNIDEDAPTKELKTEGDFANEERASLMKDLLKQYFYVQKETQLLAAFYMVFKFEIFKDRTIIVTETVEEAYRMKLFMDVANLGTAQVFNNEHTQNIRAYNLSLLNGGTIAFLIVTKDFMNSLKKARKVFVAPRNLNNIVFWNVNLNYDEYSRFIGLIRGVKDL